MESEKILMAAGVTVAAVVGAFVLWGPPGLYLNYTKNIFMNY